MVDGIRKRWEDPDFTQALSSFEGFCNLIGFGGLGEYLTSHDFDKIRDWSEQQLDEEGQAMQAAIIERSQVNSARLQAGVA
jgi:exportin-5